MPKLMVCGISFDVILRDSTARDDNNYGKCDAKMGRIYLDRNMPQAVQDSTLIHEWIHAVYEQYGVTHEEQHVSVLAVELFRSGFRLPLIWEIPSGQSILSPTLHGF